MSQIEVSKLHGWVALAPDADGVVVTKLHGWVVLVPGSGDAPASTHQGYCYTQRILR